MNKIIEKLDELILINANKENIECLDNMNLIEDLGYDSISIVNLMSDIEEKIGITFNNISELIDAFEFYNTLRALVIRFVEEQNNEKFS